MRFSVLVSFLLILTTISGHARAQEQFPSADFSELVSSGKARVTDVIDPLTVKLDDGRVIHLAGLNYPDFDPYQPGNLSVTAMDILKDFLLKQWVEVFQTRNKKAGRVNRMGHQIAHLRRKDDQSWVQGTIINLGLARVRTDRYNPEMASQMYALEKKARKENMGLWSVDAFKILTPEKAEQGIGSFQVVEGKILSVTMHENRVFLNFGADWKTDFTVSIPPGEIRYFSQKGYFPQSWMGKNVRVRGWLFFLNGPSIEIDHPEAIELEEGPDSENQPEAQSDEENEKPKRKIFYKGSALPQPSVEHKKSQGLKSLQP